MGLRSKLILAVVAVVAAGFAGAGWIAAYYVESLLVDEVHARGRALLSAMAPPCAIAMANGEFEVVDNYLGQIGESRRARELDLEYVMILDHRGRVYSHVDPTRFGDEPPGEFYQRASERSESVARRLGRDDRPALLEVTEPIVSGVRWGTLVAGFSLEREETSVEAARSQAFLIAGVLAALSGLVLFLVLTMAVLNPVRRLAEATRAFGEGELDREVALRGSDELAELGDAFNQMASELRDYTEELEQKVEERAAEILRQNRELTRLNEALQDKSAQLERLAITDGLTGLYNRRHFRERLDFEIERSGRMVHPACLVMIDVDHFKHYNDQHGHPAGDDVLVRLGKLFRDNLRSVDLVARYGGEEFVMLLLDTDLRGGQVVADKIRQAVEAAPFPFRDEQPGGRLTISLGVAAFPTHAREPDELIEAADAALYEAKAAGRNRVHVAEPGEERRG
ncbi:MAG: diguanylate cyclase [Deltaproteobacteria bacterium]|jgi:diguanylate cyclase (GGDEF)-like protein|nr:diguanylate cyclase [Deltaproteobacteria bacterium]MBW2537734.1 diguanylate cyclase [Deltaproteobacteria bacterium]